MKYQAKSGQIFEGEDKYEILKQAHEAGVINDMGAALMPKKADVKMEMYVSNGTLTEIVETEEAVQEFGFIPAEMQVFLFGKSKRQHNAAIVSYMRRTPVIGCTLEQKERLEVLAWERENPVFGCNPRPMIFADER